MNKVVICVIMYFFLRWKIAVYPNETRNLAGANKAGKFDENKLSFERVDYVTKMMVSEARPTNLNINELISLLSNFDKNTFHVLLLYIFFPSYRIRMSFGHRCLWNLVSVLTEDTIIISFAFRSISFMSTVSNRTTLPTPNTVTVAHLSVSRKWVCELMKIWRKTFFFHLQKSGNLLFWLSKTVVFIHAKIYHKHTVVLMLTTFLNSKDTCDPGNDF
jgi:hypothetical protein